MAVCQDRVRTKTCFHCGGDGLVPAYIDPLSPPATTTTCPLCGGSGKLLDGDSEMPEGVVATCAILNATDLDEYDALSDTQKEIYKIILSMGTANIGDNGNTRTLLLDMFGPGSVTRANLAALI